MTAASPTRGRCALAAEDGVAPLEHRLGLLQLLRLALAAVATGIAFAMPGPLDAQGALLAGLGAVYALTSSAVEGARRRLGLRTAAVVAGLVLFDGMYLAAAMAFTGGPQSVLAFLVLVHVIGVTLLLSFRHGLKAALWHTLLLFVTSWLQQAGVVGVGRSTTPGQAATIGALALLCVALAAAGFSSLNERELRRGKAELRALAEMATRMAGTREPVGLVHALLAGVGDAFGYARVAAVVRAGPEAEGQAFTLVPDGSVHEVAAGPWPEGARAQTAAGPSLVRALDGRHDPLLSAALPGAANVVVAPMVVDGRSLGTLAMERGGGGGVRLTVRTVDLVAQFAAHAALALRAAALQAEVERLADTDMLTGLPNRRVFQETLARDVALAARRGEECSLIMIDVDHFKAVNDTHGHQAGDEVLRLVGRALSATARKTDVAARYGGEEFAVVMPSCSGADAMVVAERLRSAIVSGSGAVPVTVSAGVAAFPSDGADPTALVAAADAALYRAKRLGRDRSVRYRPAPAARRSTGRRKVAA